ncbi:DUF5709 domain-containing protein [Gordonia humi]|uniref:DUF5709 domain-containing protein n=1 Tax=Gordonia humi TaxID=686429 RepID=A0A840F9X7_9ACTN|nr:DUF5709 domain-containing protein [Gordonia humi]MBB4136317.1 hypothetical protein [Gordonia humi]
MTEQNDPTDGNDVDDSDQLQPEDTLDAPELSDVLDRGYSPPDHEPAGHEHRSLDDRLAEQEPEVDANPGERDPDFPETAEAGELRAGRLVDSAGRGDPVVDSELVADDVGVDGAGASAEEAAVHVTDPSE